MIKQILIRVKVDFNEWRNHMFQMWDKNRDTKRILRAVEYAKKANKADGRKYIVLRDVRGFPWAYNMSEIKYMENEGILPRMNHVQRDAHALATVTSNKKTQQQYVAIQTKKEEE